ncbi:endo-1,6-alpha-mannosidase [Mycena belliarum]|uniref:Endo-1,6-alpha-mannosidase n=1 Tax=Mycena belliarum TaxID=1033014 RepID=A0AAD6TXC8_9AGAR|nr:endo-1,6-alpha-mannosidase [Mycena belliae]
MLFRVALLALVSSSAAQDLGVPLSWRKFSNSRPKSERITIAQNAINQITPQLDSGTGEFNGIGFWQSGNVWSVLANQDRLAGTTTNKALVLKNLNLVFSRTTHYDKFHVITPAQASAGRNPKKSFNIKSTCGGATMAGGVFWRPIPDDQAINSITTGLYITLSAFLAEFTKNGTYTAAAIASAKWIKAHNINSNNLVLDTVNADCSTSPAGWLFTYNSGKYIEGLSVLGAVTGDSQWTNLAINILNAAVKTRQWQGADGIITEGASPDKNGDGVGFKAVFIRGIHEAWTRNPNNTPLRTLIHSYGDVQYNALLDLAATGNTYSSAWHGPPQGFTTWGQLAALDVMTCNIDTN